MKLAEIVGLLIFLALAVALARTLLRFAMRKDRQRAIEKGLPAPVLECPYCHLAVMGDDELDRAAHLLCIGQARVEIEAEVQRRVALATEDERRYLRQKVEFERGEIAAEVERRVCEAIGMPGKGRQLEAHPSGEVDDSLITPTHWSRRQPHRWGE